MGKSLFIRGLEGDIVLFGVLLGVGAGGGVDGEVVTARERAFFDARQSVRQGNALQIGAFEKSPFSDALYAFRKRNNC